MNVEHNSPMYGPMVDRESTETMIPPWNCTFQANGNHRIIFAIVSPQQKIARMQEAEPR